MFEPGEFRDRNKESNQWNKHQLQQLNVKGKEMDKFYRGILRNLEELRKYGCFRGSERRDTGNVGARKKYREKITEGNCGQNFWDSVPCASWLRYMNSDQQCFSLPKLHFPGQAHR